MAWRGRHNANLPDFFTCQMTEPPPRPRRERAGGIPGWGEPRGARGYVAGGGGERRGWVWKACFVWKQCRYSATSSSLFFALTQRRTEKGCLYSSLIKVIGYFRSVSHTAKFAPTDFLANPHAASCLLSVHFFWQWKSNLVGRVSSILRRHAETISLIKLDSFREIFPFLIWKLSSIL